MVYLNNYWYVKKQFWKIECNFKKIPIIIKYLLLLIDIPIIIIIDINYIFNRKLKLKLKL